MGTVYLNPSIGVDGRRTEYGVWMNFRCPFCIRRGCGPDMGKHLGVLVESANKDQAKSKYKPYKCLRCGATAATTGAHIALLHAKGAESPPKLSWEEAQAHAQDAKREAEKRSERRFRPMAELEAEHPIRRHLTKLIRQYWRGITFEQVAERGAGYDPGDLTEVSLPYVTVAPGLFTRGYVLRRFQGSPKVLTIGPPGPAFFRDTTGSKPDLYVVVEGWADACAVWSPTHTASAIMLLGSGGTDTGRLLSTLDSQLVLLPDADTPGIQGCKRLSATLTRLGRAHSVALLDWALDPADAGRIAVGRVLQQRSELKTAKDFAIFWAGI